MSVWKYKIELNQVLRDMSNTFDLTCVEEPCPKSVKRAIAKELEKVPGLVPLSKKAMRVKSIAAMNRLLEEIFDAADRQLVWLGA